MKQAVIRSVTGTPIRFIPTNIIRLAALTNNELLRVLDYIKPEGIYENDPLALVEKYRLPNGGYYAQRNILKAVLISKKLWDASILAHPAALPFIVEGAVDDSAIMAAGKFNDLVSRIYPIQRRESKYVELDGAGTVSIGVAFDSATLISPYLPVSFVEDTGSFDFGVGHANEIFEITYVTKSIYPVFRIITIKDNVGVSHSYKEIQAYLLHQDVATLLGITLPTV